MMNAFEELETGALPRRTHRLTVNDAVRKCQLLPCGTTFSAAARRLMVLPSDAMQTPPWDALEGILGDRSSLLSVACELVVPVLPSETEDVLRSFRSEITDVRRGWLVALLGEWRDPRATPALISCLGERAVWGWDDLIHAFTRIGPPAVELLRQVANDRLIPSLARERAVRALGSIASALGCDAYDPYRWNTSAGALRERILVDLELLLNLQTNDSSRLVFRAAESLCANGARHCMNRVETLYEHGPLRQFDADDMTDRFALRALLSGDRQLSGYGLATYSIFSALGFNVRNAEKERHEDSR